MKGDHYAVVITPRTFNDTFGLAWVCPITTGKQQASRGLTAVSLVGSGTKFVGAVMCHQLKSVDWTARNGKKVGRLGGTTLAQILEICTAIVDPSRR